MIGVILAAGDGTRLKSSRNEQCCKPLIKINNNYLIEFSLANLSELGVTEAYIVIGKEGALVKNALGDEYNGIKLQYVYQLEQKGLINAFMQAVKDINTSESIVLQLSDEIFIKFHVERIRNTLNKSDVDFCCGVTHEDNPQKIKNNYSVEITDDSDLVSCIEKPTEVTNNIKGTGFCIFNKSSLNVLREIYDENTNTPKDLCDYMNILTARGHKGSVVFIADKEYNVNTSSDLREAKNNL